MLHEEKNIDGSYVCPVQISLKNKRNHSNNMTITNKFLL